VKRLPALFFFLIISFNLYAQNVREAKIFVPPVTGIGSTEETAYFYRQLTNEVIAQSHTLIRLKSGSDYSLIGIIKPLTCYHDPSTICPANSGHQHKDIISPERVFHLELQKTSTSEVIGEQYIVYSDYEPKLMDMISTLVYNLISGIPDILTVDDARRKWLFAGIYGMWAPRIYNGINNDHESVYLVNFGLGIEAEVHFVNFMALNFGLQFSQDWIVISSEEKTDNIDVILEIPLTLKFIIKPGNSYLLEPYAGISYNFSLMDVTKPSGYSWFVGLEFGMLAGPGFITIDPRFSMDIFSSHLDSQLEYRRSMIQIAVGYKFGFFQKNKKKDY